MESDVTSKEEEEEAEVATATALQAKEDKPRISKFLRKREGERERKTAAREGGRSPLGQV